jgi:tripartite-type tricarboxylate transporter receptor subunit TctC
MTSLRLLLGVLALVTICPAPSEAEDYPSRPIRLVVPVPPGAINDLVARMVGASITAQTGQPVVIENRAGAAGNIALGAVARAAPDGYTLLVASGAHITTNRLVYKMPDINPLKDLVPIAPIAGIKLIFAVNKNVPAKTLREFIALVRRSPARSTSHLPGPARPPISPANGWRALPESNSCMCRIAAPSRRWSTWWPAMSRRSRSA